VVPIKHHLEAWALDLKQNIVVGVCQQIEGIRRVSIPLQPSSNVVQHLVQRPDAHIQVNRMETALRILIAHVAIVKTSGTCAVAHLIRQRNSVFAFVKPCGWSIFEA
jgi:hypothetical protein